MPNYRLTAKQIPCKSPNEGRLAAFSFDDVLESGETFTGTPTIAEVTTTDLTLANKAVSGGALTILGESVSTGRALVCKVSGGTAGNTYRIRCTCSTTGGTVTQTIERDFLLEVVASGS